VVICDQFIQFTITEYGKTDTAYANALELKSDCFIATKKFNDALIIEQEVLSIRRAIPNCEAGVIKSLNTLYQLHKYTGQMIRGSAYMIEAVELQEKINPDDTLLNILYNNIAGMYRDLGLLNEAEIYFLQGLEVIKKHYGENAMQGANLLNNTGGLYRLLGNYSQSEIYFLQLYDLLVNVSGSKHPKTRSAINNLAVINRDLGNYAKAEYYFLKALDIDISVDTMSYVATLHNMAAVYNSQNKLDEAEKSYLRAAELQVLMGEDMDGLATTYFKLGELYVDKKDAVNARIYFTKSLDMRKEILGEKHFNYGMSILGLSSVDFLEKNQQASIEKAKKAKEILLAAVGNKHGLYESALYHLGDYYFFFEQGDSAEPYYIEALHLQYHLMKEQFSYTSEMEKENYMKKISNRSAAFLRFSLKRKQENPAITGEVYNYVLNTKGILLKSSSSLRNSILESDDAQLKDKYDQWIQLKKKINSLYNTPVEKRKDDLTKLEENANNLEKELVRSSAELASDSSVMNNSWLDVKSNLQTNEAAVEFIHFKKNKDSVVYCALILKPTSDYPEMVELFEERQLRDLIGNSASNNFNLINTVYGTRTKKNAALYDLIWKPLETILGKTKKVHVSASGLLHKISFAGLMRADGNYLSDLVNLDMMATTADIDKSTAFEIGANEQIGLFGGINYSTDSSNSYPWTYLNGTKTESDALANTFKNYSSQVNYMTGDQGSKSNFISLAEKSSILHIATHGFFFPDPMALNQSLVDSTESGSITFRGGPSRASALYVNSQNPLMRSGLVFAGANDYWNGDEFSRENNGVLTAMDVLNIDLRKNKLVVMSACESGLGDIVDGEGVYGLQRAFKMAGTDFIIMSLWQVPDKETAEFMTNFYKLLFKRKDISVAFNETQKIMRKKYDPYYWAAFVLQR
jgi:CHAT domain-containing protein